MSYIWNKMKDCAHTMQAMMESAGWRYDDPVLEKYSWENHIYRSDKYRRGHVEVVDKTDTHGIFILHATVFPNVDDSSPIWGFDTVCGKSKITGAFHDFSLVSDQHFMYDWFKESTKDITWKKERELPEWARNIFSPSMIAAGNINDEKELDMIVDLGINSLRFYLDNVGKTRDTKSDYRERQNFYCKNQKMNPHVIKSMTTMGYSEDIMQEFVHEVLFPEI
jgi:hypothetical protein